jgi:hypothetical protein
MLKDFIGKQTAFNKTIEEKFGKIDALASKVDSLALDVDLLKTKVMPHDTLGDKTFATANAIQVRIDDNMRLLAELHARWEREDEIARNNKISKVCTITITSNTEASNASKPLTTNGKTQSVGKVPTTYRKVQKPTKTVPDKCAEIFRSMGDNCPFTFDNNDFDFDFDGCNVTEVIKFLQRLAETPNASEINVAFTKHITNAIMQIREEKLKHKASIPRRLEDSWEPMVRMQIDEFDCNALCDLGASISVMPRKIYDMLDLPPLEKCYVDVHLVDAAAKKPLGRVNDVLIRVNNNFVPVDFVVLDIECNATCPIILGRPFLRTAGAIIDMRDGIIRYQFPLKKGMEHFPRKRKKSAFDSIIRTNYGVDTSSFENT